MRQSFAAAALVFALLAPAPSAAQSTPNAPPAALRAGGAAAPQGLSPALGRAVPDAAQRLNSPDVGERIGVLHQLLAEERQSDTASSVPHFVYELPASDYDLVGRAILSCDPAEVVAAAEVTAGTWWRLLHLVSISQEVELPGLAASYLERTTPVVQSQILASLKAVGAAHLAPRIARLLDSPEESVRRQALDTLVALRAKEAVPALLTLLKDADGAKRYHALDWLVRVGARAATRTRVRRPLWPSR